MARTVGVELSPGRCVLVELTGRGDTVRLSRFVSIEAGSDEPERLAGELRRVRREWGLPRRVRAVVWSGASLVPTLDGDYQDRAEALRLAGFALETATSPAEALATLNATLGRDTTRAPATYLAVNSDGAALSVVRNGDLLIGHEFDWSTLDDPRDPDRRALGRRLGAAVKHVLREAGAASGPLDPITVCGSLPQLRSLTLPLGEALGRLIEILDTIEGVDTAGMEIPIIELQKDLAGLRLAWAVAAGPVSHAPPSAGPPAWRRPVAAAGVLVMALAATVFACWPRERTPTMIRQSDSAPAPPSVARTFEPVSPEVTPAPPAVTVPPAPAPPVALAPRSPEAARSQPVAPATAARRVTPAPRTPRAGSPAWKLQSILISNGRRLAIIDGRIVGPGDRVGRDVVIDIGEREVTFADATGREGRVQLWAEKPGVVVR